MLEIALILVNFLNFYPQNLWEFVSEIAPSEINVRFEQESFDQQKGLEVGAPVVFRGNIVGRVSGIQTPGHEAVSPKSAVETKVSLTLVGRRFIRKGAVAILSAHQANATGRPIHFIEILSPEVTDAPPDKTLERLDGFTSYLEFWRSESSHKWIDSRVAKS